MYLSALARSPWRAVAAGALIALTVLAGCAPVGPNYVRPDIAVPEAWRGQPAQAKGASPQDEAETLSSWWTAFGDAELDSLIRRAVAGSLDVKAARAKIREARARRGIAQADLYPTLDASATATKTYAAQPSETGASGSGASATTYAAGFDAGWELDIFGGVRRAVEASTADLQVQEENLRDVLVSLLGEVALNYVDVRTYQERLSVTKTNLESQTQTHQLTVWRREAGLSDQLAVEQAKYALENTRSQIPGLETALDTAMNNIALLLGEPPGSVHGELAAPGAIPAAAEHAAVGIPADVIRHRPDVRKAERELAAQTARIGVATADLYPKFSLSGSIGLESLSSGHLFSSDSASSSGGGIINWSLFKGGAIRRNIQAQTAIQEQDAIAYEATVLGALKEVENALTAFAREEERRASLSAAAEAAQRANNLVLEEYQAGMVDFNNVLDTQRTLLNDQNELAASEGAVASDLIRLYKALGGGWTSLAPEGGKTS